jgi:hypothetical protein
VEKRQHPSDDLVPSSPQTRKQSFTVVSPIVKIFWKSLEYGELFILTSTLYMGAVDAALLAPSEGVETQANHCPSSPSPCWPGEVPDFLLFRLPALLPLLVLPPLLLLLRVPLKVRARGRLWELPLRSSGSSPEADTPW